MIMKKVYNAIPRDLRRDCIMFIEVDVGAKTKIVWLPLVELETRNLKVTADWDCD